MSPNAVWHTQRSNAVNGEPETGNGFCGSTEARCSDKVAPPAASQLPLTGNVPVGQICAHSTPEPAPHCLYSHWQLPKLGPGGPGGPAGHGSAAQAGFSTTPQLSWAGPTSRPATS